MLAAWLVLALGQVQLPSPVPDLDFGAIAGRVCIDRDGDGRCSSDEPGLGGVRVMMENGLWSVTDADGRYHFAHVEGETFALDYAGGPRGSRSVVTA